MSLDQPQGFVKHQSVTRDAFLGGRLTLSQPAGGFRAGLDSVLLGAAVAPGRKGLLDMGCGVGTAGFVALAHNPDLQATLVDQNVEMTALAARNAQENGFASRCSIVLSDIAAKGSARRAAGIGENAYDAVIANPPFFDSGSGTLSADAARADARHMDADLLDLWIRAAAGAASGGGEIIFVYPAESLAPLLSGFAHRFGALTLLPLVPRAGQRASRVLIRGIKGSRAPLTILQSRILHGEGRGFTPEFDAIFRGEARLDW